MIKRWICAILVIALGMGIWHVAGITYDPMYGAVDVETQVVEQVNPDIDEKVITIWYTDEALTDYLNSVALLYQKNTGNRVNIELKSGVGYLENINSISIMDVEDREDSMPDLYITSHDNLLRAHLAGLAAEVMDPQKIMNNSVFPEVALSAVTCYGSYVGYPLYYETSYFLYNKTYMASIAQNKIESEEDLAEGAAATAKIESGEVDLNKDNSELSQEEIDKLNGIDRKDETSASEETADKQDDKTSENSDDEVTESESETDSDLGLDSYSDEEGLAEGETDPMGDEDAQVSREVLEKLSTMIPQTLEDIKTFADNYDAPEQVESVFKWDVTDIFYNYFFVGNYVEVGGEEGDNTAVFNIYNSQSVECLSAYQNMNQYFTIDTAVDNYDKILQDFIDGKLVFTVATTDAIAKIQKAKNNGDFQFDYGVTTLPDVSSLLKTKGLSVTDAVAINEYSTKQLQANEFASYLVAYKADELYKKTGKISCDKAVSYEDEEINNIFAEYEKSIPLPKMVEAANYWVQLEIAFTKVWKGADPDTTLKELSDTIGAQIEEIRANLPTQESFSAGAAKYVW